MKNPLSGWAGNLILRGLDLLPARTILAIEISDDQLYGAVVQAHGRKTTIVDFVSSERKNPGEDLPDSDDLDALAKRLSYSGRTVVLVTPLTRTVQLSVESTRLRKLKNYQLAESLRWEVEPFTGINGATALVGVEPQQQDKDDILITLDGEQESDVQVSVMEKNVFLALRQICKRAGLKMQRIYAPDSCFYLPAVDGDDARAVLDIGTDLSAFVVIKGRQPQQISAYPLGRESLRELAEGENASELESSLRFIIEQAPPPKPLLVTGPGALDSHIVAWLDDLCPNGAEALSLSKERNLSKADHAAFNAVFATSVGAGLRELLGAARRYIGIDDTAPLSVRLKDNAYMMPMVVAVLLALTLFGHYEWMVFQKNNYDQQIKELAAKVEAREKSNTLYQNHKQQVDGLSGEIRILENQINFVTGGSDNNLERLQRTLTALGQLPDHLTLANVIQHGCRYTLKGEALDADGVSRFAVTLQHYPWCQTVKVTELKFDLDRFVFTLELELTDHAQTDQA